MTAPDQNLPPETPTTVDPPVVVDPPADPPAPQPIVSTEEMNKLIDSRVQAARKDEKDKLYPDLKEAKDKVSALSQELEDLKSAADQTPPFDPDSATLKERMTELESVIQDQKEDIRLSREQMDLASQKAVLERQDLEMSSYRNRRIQEILTSGEKLVPELVSGNTQDEIEASLVVATARHREITNEALSTDMAHREGTPLAGGGVSGPTSGQAVESPSTQEGITAEQIRAMPLSEYKQHRDQILEASGVAVDTERLTPRQ